MEDFFKNQNPQDAPKSVDSIVAQGFSVQTGLYIQSGFKNFSSEGGIYVAFTLVYIAISMAASSLPVIGNLANTLVGVPLIVGFIYYGRLQRRNEFRDFSTFFFGFKNGQWPSFVMQGIMVNLCMIFLISAVILSLFWEPLQVFISQWEKIETMDQDKIGEFVVSIFTPAIIQTVGISAVIALVVATFFCLAPFFIVYRRYSAFEALGASWRIVKSKFPAFLLFNLVLWLMLTAGILLCCVGFLAALPVYYLALTSAYEDITGD
jgi:hypothetical protein